VVTQATPYNSKPISQIPQQEGTLLSSSPLDRPPNEFIQTFIDLPLAQPPQSQVSPQIPAHGLNVPPNTCLICSRSFSLPCQLNQHIKSHTRPFKCPVPSCPRQGFHLRKDRRRHINSKHSGLDPDTGRYYCPFEGCKYSKKKGNGMSRLDNLRRHRVTHEKSGTQ